MRGLAFMPLDVGRLLDSDLFAISTGDEFKAAVALWCKCWTQIPASSLPDDDRILAHLSGAGSLSRWKKLRDVALRGFVKCSDGRLYHAVIAEKVRETWKMRQTQRAKAVAGNEVRWGQKDKQDQQKPDRSGDATGDPPRDPVRDPTGDRKGQCKYKGEKEERSLSVQDEPTGEGDAPIPKGRITYSADFLAAWDGYPTDANMSKKEAFGFWIKLSPSDREDVIKSLPGFRAYCASKPDYRPIHFCRYLSKRRADGFLEAAEKLEAQAANALTFVEQGSDAWAEWVRHRGKEPPTTNQGNTTRRGWYFPTEFPPKELVH